VDVLVEMSLRQNADAFVNFNMSVQLDSRHRQVFDADEKLQKIIATLSDGTSCYPAVLRDIPKLTSMRTPLHRAFVFSATVFLLLLVADAAAWGGYQGLEPDGQEGPLILIHAAVLGGALVSTFLGSCVVFSLRRNQIPSAQTTAYLALAFAVISFYAVVASFTAAGILGMLAWLVFGAALFAAFGTLRKPPNG